MVFSYFFVLKKDDTISQEYSLFLISKKLKFKITLYELLYIIFIQKLLIYYYNKLIKLLRFEKKIHD